MAYLIFSFLSVQEDRDSSSISSTSLVCQRLSLKNHPPSSLQRPPHLPRFSHAARFTQHGNKDGSPMVTGIFGEMGVFGSSSGSSNYGLVSFFPAYAQTRKNATMQSMRRCLHTSECKAVKPWGYRAMQNRIRGNPHFLRNSDNAPIAQSAQPLPQTGSSCSETPIPMRYLTS